MLLNIVTGYRGIVQHPQREIVYICCKLEAFEQRALPFVFTNGHAKDSLTSFYTNRESLREIDWDLVKARYWKNTEIDERRQWRKQAEFLVVKHVPPDCIDAIVVFDRDMFDYATEIITRLGLHPKVYIDTENRFYY
jgi:hypothetical protein